MSYDRTKPLNSGMLKKDFRGFNAGGIRAQLRNWDAIMDKKYSRALGRARVRLVQAEKKRQEDERRRLQRDAATAA